MYSCKICNNNFESPLYVAHEVRFGWNHPFEYIRCPHCNCVQIREIPANLGSYYPTDYYSLKERSAEESNGLVRRLMRNYLLRYRLDGKNRIGKALSLLEKNAFEWIEPNQFNFNSSILDVGCGTGRTILKLARSGFKNVRGIDPFLESDILYRLKGQQVLIQSKEVGELREKFDVITLTHVMEHIANPHESLQAIVNIMHPDSLLILTLPLMSEFAWNHYGIKAYPFEDVPRHLFIYSLNGLCRLAQMYGLRLTHSKFFYSPKILEDVYGHMAPQIKEMDRKKLAKELLETHDSGLAYLTFKLQP